ncbi:MAG: hypothetical protein HYW16_00090, partial [Candidatus Rokubacteria bacterium]|nr:hypothetical protein [Candidatus Rokubacteria bacterium]
MRNLRMIPLVLVVLALAVLLPPGPAPAQQATWKLQSLLNPGYMGTDAEIWFAQEVEKRTGGKVKITVYPGAALGFAGPRIMTAVGQGLLE